MYIFESIKVFQKGLRRGNRFLYCIGNIQQACQFTRFLNEK